MSGIVGHTMYAILGGKAAAMRKSPVAPIVHRHWGSYLCGAYLGCDIQTLPAAVCLDTGQEIGYGSQPLERSPLTGGPVKPWVLEHEGEQLTPRDIHRMFYGRAHVVFGWSPDQRQHVVPWDHLPDYAAMTVQDALDLFGPGERKLAYLFGWMAHIVGDSLIKSVQPGITLHLLDGKYTPANRPIQDLVTLHEVGRKEFRLNWRDLLSDLAEAPLEPVQLHYMRIGKARGLLGESFPNAWAPRHETLLRRVLHENRRYQQIRNPRLLERYALTKTQSGWQCNGQLSRATGGLSYAEMLEAADKANFRHALWQMGEAVADLFDQVVDRVPSLQDLPADTGPTWDQITARWRVK
jgi:hypothetical protein